MKIKWKRKELPMDWQKREGLLKVRQEGNKSAIIFVHGLRGDPYETWTKKGSNSLPEMFTEDETYDHYDVFTFGYNTGFIFKRQHFKEVSKLLYTEVKAKLDDYDVFYFITHSMGGIIVQNMLTEQVEHRNKDFLEAVNGVVYLAVPFLGSSIATTASIPYMFIPPILGEKAVSIQVRSLRVFSKDLAELADKWVRYRGEELAHLHELNLYGQSDKTVAVASARAPYIKNSLAVSEGHISICKMDMDSTVYQLISNFYQENGQTLNKRSLNTAEMEISRYLQWLKQRTEKFIVPGVNIPLSIEHAWASLHVIDEPNETINDSLEKEIAKYHEWERLSHRRNPKKSAQEITELGKRVILIGGPGSGKSTLVRRAVNRLAAKGEKVLYVRLPQLSKEMEQGKSFEDALWSVALDGYAGDKELLKSVIGHTNILIADGLDECEPLRRRVSQSLYEWSIGRKDTRVVVTTRPVGYESVQFNTFHHVEILPLDEVEIKTYSLKLLQTLNNDKKKVEEMHSKFKQQLENNKMTNVAARSPLLLNFLVQLLISGKNFGKYRAELYSRVLEEWIRQSDRVKNKKLNEQVAIRSIEWIGWILQNVLDSNGGRSKQEVLQKLSSFIEDELDVRPLQAKEIATDCLQFWINIGVLEHLEVGYENGYTFIHLTLGEYAAGKYISSLPEERQREIYIERMHSPIWRETLLLAGGAGSARLFVETILEITNDKLDLYNDIAFAAAILAESPPLSDLSKKVAEKAIDTISSSISMLSYEAGEALEGIAQQEPDWTLTLVNPLLQHGQEWTNLVAYKLALLTRQFIIDETTALKLIALKPRESITSMENFKIPTGWLEWNKVIELAMEQLISNETLDEGELVKVIEALGKVGFSAHFHIEFSRMLQEIGRYDLLEILNSSHKNSLNQFDFHKDSLRMLEGEKALLASVLRQIPNRQEWYFGEGEPLFEIGKLYHGMQLGESPVFDLDPLVEGVKLSAVDEVIKGMLLVHEIGEEDIYNEARWVLNNLENNKSLLSKLPVITEHEPNWQKAEFLLDKSLLIQSLSYPSKGIAINASLLLVNCFEASEVKAPFYEAFMEAEGNSLFYFTIVAEYILEDNALYAILERLKKTQTNGLRYLYGILPNFSQAGNHELILTSLMNGINNDKSIVVKSAAEAMLKIGEGYNEEEVFKIATFWDENGVLCERHGIRVVGSYCPECRVVPKSPLPELIKLSKKGEIFSLDDRKYFSKHPRSDVQKAGFEALAYFLSTDSKEMKRLVIEIKDGKETSVLLEAIFSMDYSKLKPISDELLSLIESNNFDVRSRLIKELANSQWVDQIEAIPILEKALNDKNFKVRNQAVITYRSLRL
ncbi:NACHT domain-containing protein [Jeotgalibacillus salarius]|uniref:NACHT domain-containing protein n=1 Tax=Jeotgalibacillus salarius TaxID=546023 RepID=UPI00141B23D6|nr:NACHT domain-containing protein [Jeotgalibacillus salarius]